jgi:hypothetical protein
MFNIYSCIWTLRYYILNFDNQFKIIQIKHNNLDSQLTGIQCRYLSTNTEKISNEKTEWIALEKRIDHNNNNPELAEKDNLTHFMPGGGIAQKWWKIRFLFFQ